MWLGGDGSGGSGRRCAMSARADRNDLSPALRRRLFGLGLLRALATTIVLVALYYLLPLDHITNVPLTLAAGVVILLAVTVWQVRAIIRARYPALVVYSPTATRRRRPGSSARTPPARRATPAATSYRRQLESAICMDLTSGRARPGRSGLALRRVMDGAVTQVGQVPRGRGEVVVVVEDREVMVRGGGADQQVYGGQRAMGPVA
jgi:hypothetical protein